MSRIKKVIIFLCILIIGLNSLNLTALADTVEISPEDERLKTIDLKNRSQEEIKSIFEQYGVMYKDDEKYDKLEVVLPEEGSISTYNDKDPITGIYHGKQYIISYKHFNESPEVKTCTGMKAFAGWALDTAVNIAIGFAKPYIWIPYAILGVNPTTIIGNKESPESKITTQIDTHMVEKTFSFIQDGRAIPRAALQRAEVTDTTTLRVVIDASTSRYTTNTGVKTTFYEFPYYRNNTFGLARAEEQVSSYGFIGRPDSKVHTLSYQSHVQNIGWQNKKQDGELSGTVNKSLRLEGIKMSIDSGSLNGTIQYRSHVQNLGWQGWVKNGALSGTSGKGLRLEAIQIKLNGTLAEQYDVFYRVHGKDYGWQDWKKNGATAGTVGKEKRLEAVQIQLRAK